jgi:hypothetical protein
MANRQTDMEDTMALRVPKAEIPSALSERMINRLVPCPNPSR